MCSYRNHWGPRASHFQSKFRWRYANDGLLGCDPQGVRAAYASRTCGRFAAVCDGRSKLLLSHVSGHWPGCTYSVLLGPWIHSKIIHVNSKRIGAVNEWRATSQREEFTATSSLTLCETIRRRDRINLIGLHQLPTRTPQGGVM